MLIGTQRRARLLGSAVQLAAPSPPVAKLLRSTGLDRSFTINRDLSGALASLRCQSARTTPASGPGREGTPSGARWLRGLAAKERAEDLKAMTWLIESGAITPVIDRTYALVDAPDAIRCLARVMPQERSSSPVCIRTGVIIDHDDRPELVGGGPEVRWRRQRVGDRVDRPAHMHRDHVRAVLGQARRVALSPWLRP